jgi:hypothetical protein
LTEPTADRVPVFGALTSAGSSQTPLLYVVDTDHQDQDNKAQVLVVDPQQKAIVKTYPAGYHPDVAVSQDGKRLYLAYGSTLEVIDTSTGAIIGSVNAPDRVFDTFDDLVSHMALSADGGLLYALRVKDLGNGEDAYGVAVFDTNANKFLPDAVSLPRCDNPLLVPSSADRALSIICGSTREIRIARFDNKGVPMTRLPLGFPFGQNENPQAEVVTAFASGEREVTVVFSDGGYARINLQGKLSAQSGAIAFSPSLKESASVVGPYATTVVGGSAYLVIAAADDYRSSELATQSQFWI